MNDRLPFNPLQAQTGGLVMASYVPQQGDLVALDFDPQSGHGQKG